MNPDLANPATDTLDDYEAVRLSDDGPLCWLFVGEHRGVEELPAVNAWGSEALS